MFPLSVYSLDKELHSGGTGWLPLIGDMAVHIKSKSGGSGTKVFLHSLDIIAGFDACHGIRVPQIVEPGFGASDGFYHLFEVQIPGCRV